MKRPWGNRQAHRLGGSRAELFIRSPEGGFRQRKDEGGAVPGPARCLEAGPNRFFCPDCGFAVVLAAPRLQMHCTIKIKPH